jgi:cardiolipin synthase
MPLLERDEVPQHSVTLPARRSYGLDGHHQLHAPARLPVHVPAHMSVHLLAPSPRRTLRLLAGALGSFVGLQMAIVAVLLAIARRRRGRSPAKGFPYLDTDEVTMGDNRLQIYSYGGELFDAMLAAIDGAQDSIYLESYIWKADVLGQQFKDHLAAKAAQGVNVYVIFDNFGNLVVPDTFKAFPPSIHKLKYSAIHRPWHLLDPRRYALDHRKLLVVDGKVSFIGGYNIGYLYATEWRDTHLRIEGPAARDLARAFAGFWNRYGPRKDRIPRYYLRRFDPTIAAHSNDALRLTFPIRNMYIDAIDRARHHIYLTNAYFIPDHTVLEALAAAAQRGVDVQVLIPWTSNHIVADWVSRSYFTTCLKAGIRIFGYKQAMIHAKTCTIDGQWSTIGTANIDRLSSLGNNEINLEIYNRALAREMEALFACDKTNAFELTPRIWERRPWYVKLSERVLKPLRFVL